MEALECITTRRSVRKFTGKPVSRDVIKSVVAAAQLAPSWKNTQTTRFSAITDRANIEKIADLLKSESNHLGDWNAKIVSGAQALVLVSVITGQSGHESDGSPSTANGEGYTFFDCGCAAENLCLAAHAKGLATVILGHFDFISLAQITHLPEKQRPVVLIAMGYGENAAAQTPPARKPLEQVLSFV